MARRSPSQLSGRPLVNAITARSKGPGASAPKEEVPLSVNPAVREFVIASAVAKYASFREHTVPQRAHVFRVYLNGSGHVRRLLAETGDPNQHSKPLISQHVPIAAPPNLHSNLPSPPDEQHRLASPDGTDHSDGVGPTLY